MKSSKILLTAAAAGLVLTPLGWIPAAQAAPGESSLVVTVYDDYDGHSLPGLQVGLFDTATGRQVAQQTLTEDDFDTPWDDSRTAVFEGLAPGTYTAKAHDPAGKYVDRYSVARTLAEGDGSEIDIPMRSRTAQFGTVEGELTQLTDGDLEASVLVYRSDVTTAQIEDGSAEVLRSAYAWDNSWDGEQTLLDADWSLDLAPGSYKLRAVDNDSFYCDDDGCRNSRVAWVGGSSAETAKVVTVSAGKDVEVPTVRLPDEVDEGVRRITGTITGAGGAKLDDIEVDLLQRLGDEWREVASTETGADGTYGFANAESCFVESYEYYEEVYDHVVCDGTGPVRGGTYTLRFSDDAGIESLDSSSSGREYATAYYGNVAPAEENPWDVPGTAATVELGDSDVQTANIGMTRIPLDTSSGLYGRLTDDTGAGARGRVVLFDSTGSRVDTVEVRRDGTWSAPVTSLAPGSYRILTETRDLVDRWVGGGMLLRTATPYTLPVTGSTNVGSSRNLRYAEVTGKVSMSGVKGVNALEADVSIYDTKGRRVSGAGTDRRGNFSLDLPPGTYLASAGGGAYDTFDRSNGGQSWQPLIERFWKTSWTMAGATKLVVKSGATVSGLNFALSDQLAAASAPRISGTPKVGKTLTASAGAWNETDGVTFTYAWKRGSKVVGTKSTYKVTAKDKNKQITLVVTATDSTRTYRAGTASATVKVPKKG